MAGNYSFPLDYILNLNAITVDFILPLIEPNDLATLEVIDKRCNDAIKGNELWKSMMRVYLRDHNVAKKIITLYGIDENDYLEEFPKYLYGIFVRTHRQVSLNLQEGRFLSCAFTCEDTENDGDKYYRAIAIHNNGNLVFAAHDKNVDVLKYGSDDGEGKELEFSHHVSWGNEEAKDTEEAAFVRELDVYARFISVQDDLLFIAHFSGTITVWNWKAKQFLTKFRGHLIRKSFASPIKSFRVDGLTIAIGFLDGWVAILQLEQTQLVMKGFIDPTLNGDLRAVDVNEGCVAVGYENTIMIWDVETMTQVKLIPWELEHLVELLFNKKRQKILVGNIFGNEFHMIDVRRCVVERRFFLPDDATMTTISTDWRHHVVAGTWEAAVYSWNIEGKENSKAVKIYQSKTSSIRQFSQRSYRASGIDHLIFNGIYLTFIERFGINVKLLDLTVDDKKTCDRE